MLVFNTKNKEINTFWDLIKIQHSMSTFNFYPQSLQLSSCYVKQGAH